MSEQVKKHENFFKFGLYQNNQVVIERIFSADNYNPVVRYSVDIRDKISEIISELNKTLSKKSLSYNAIEYNNLQWYQNQVKLDNKVFKNKLASKLEYPETVKFKKGNHQEFYGVPFKIGLYINNHPIVEREFGVAEYNTSARFSKELVDVVNVIVKNIQKHLYNTDINHMWNDFDIITTFGLNIGQIRELTKSKRQELLKNLKNYEFIKKVRNEYRVINSNDVEEEVESTTI